MSTKDKLQTLGFAGQVAATILREKVGPKIRPAGLADVPPTPEHINAEWLTAILCKEVPGAKVLDFELGRGSKGTSSRRALTVRYNDVGTEAGLPGHLFTKSTATFASRLLLGLTAIGEGEALFYNRMRPELNVRSPRAFHAGYDPKSYRSMVVLEDLAPRGWTFPDPMRTVVTRSDAEDIVTQLASYHAAFWNSPRFSGDLAGLRPAYEWQQNLNRKTPFEKRTLVGLDRAKDVVPAELYDRRGELYGAFMRSLAMHSQGPVTLLHQDVHLGNWLRDDTGRMGLYDWQCVARGSWALDFSYALAGCLTTDDRRDWEKDLLRLYLERLTDNGVADAPSFDQAYLSYRQQPLHSFAFALFTLGGNRFEPELQPRDFTISAIERVARHVTDLDTLNAIG